METPGPFNNGSSSVVATPRPNSRQSIGTASNASGSPPSSNSTNFLTTAVDHSPVAAVAVVPANNHSTASEATSSTLTTTKNNCQQQSATTTTNDPEDTVDQSDMDFPSFDNPDDVSDVTLEVEGKNLHVHRTMLSLISPVFKAMLNGDFLERKQNVIKLKDKKYDEMVEFLQCIYPPWKPISGNNVKIILKFADEYHVDGLLRRCEDFLLALKMAKDTHEHRLWAYDQGRFLPIVSRIYT